MGKRLTTKENGEYRLILPDHYDGDLSNFNAELERAIDQSIDKLGQLEDFEDELGIDLIILLKALMQGIYWKEKEGKQTDIEIGDGHLKIHFNNGYMRDGWAVVYFEDYGKTWALTEKELKQ